MTITQEQLLASGLPEFVQAVCESVDCMAHEFGHVGVGGGFLDGDMENEVWLVHHLGEFIAFREWPAAEDELRTWLRSQHERAVPEA